MLEPDDEDLAHPAPLAAVVTVGSDQCFVVAHVDDHPIGEGAALLNWLAVAPEHGVCRMTARQAVRLQ
ncbi:hypothetical protein [Kitasatospora sp. NPDC048407]|uniref:hypothetical protein n=1 Tax=Kitasatospora sp. NPDC048407 TaxID=3364051 RepID=UPI00371C23FC